ncbi:MAG: hypothetical protein K2P66_08805 [Lachnospiraceae bacterium]|nr:hypothetical protein [Lachnospiraceae bacterium]
MKKKNPKQIAALLCVVLLISLYVVTFLVACFGSVDSGRLFVACLGATIALPVLLWILLWFYDLMKKRQSQVLSDLLDSETTSAPCADTRSRKEPPRS